MAFCTACGATVTGAFCNQCGTPAAGAGAGAQPAPPSPYGQPMPTGALPLARKTSPVVWILVIVLGFFVLGGIAIVGMAAFVAHRARQAGLDFGRGRNGGITFQARGNDGKNARIEFGTSSKLPSWVPVYPGSDATATFAIKASGDGGEGGNFTFTTSDSGSHVKEFYQNKFKELGMKVNLETTSDEAGMMIATDDGTENKRSLTVVVGNDHSGLTTVNVTYGLK
jgi:hypothetical protein